MRTHLLSSGPMILDMLLVLVLVAANGFFVAAEFALVKCRIGELKVLEETGKRGARAVVGILGNLDTYLSSCQLGITLASLGLGWVGEPLIAKSLEPLFEHFGIPHARTHLIAFPVSFAFITFLHITIGEQVPKMYAIQRYRTASMFCAYPLIGFTKLLKPAIWVLNAASNAMLRGIGIHTGGGHGDVPNESELRLMLGESAAVGHLTAREQDLMENALDLGDKVTRVYMLPRNKIEYINLQDGAAACLKKAADSTHTRLPVCEGDLANIVGVMHVKDAFRSLAHGKNLDDLKSILREPCRLHETATLDVAAREMQRKHLHLALVFDEHGVLSGLITLEDVLEQLVGQIQDEFDEETPTIRKTASGVHEVAGSVLIADLVGATELDLDTSAVGADTVGGYLTDMLDHFPIAGERISVGDHDLVVVEAEPTRVLRVQIRPTAPVETVDKEA